MKGDLEIRGYTVAQSPNPPLVLALVGLVAGWLLASDSTAHAIARAAFYIGLSVWAWLEMAEGVNLFRRTLGVAGLVYILVTLSGELD